LCRKIISSKLSFLDIFPVKYPVLELYPMICIQIGLGVGVGVDVGVSVGVDLGVGVGVGVGVGLMSIK
jgi:hypothetical protein